MQSTLSKPAANVALAHFSSRSLSDRVSGFGLAASADWRRASNSFYGENASAGLKSTSSLQVSARVAVSSSVIGSLKETHNCSIFASSRIFWI